MSILSFLVSEPSYTLQLMHKTGIPPFCIALMLLNMFIARLSEDPVSVDPLGVAQLHNLQKDVISKDYKPSLCWFCGFRLLLCNVRGLLRSKIVDGMTQNTGFYCVNVHVHIVQTSSPQNCTLWNLYT